MTINHRYRSSPAFTIVELLVVIVVIGILAAITIVSYSGIQGRATIASLSSDLTNASTQLKLFNVDNSNYPSTISTDCTANPDTTINKCLKPSINTTYTYKTSPTNHSIFCLEAIKSSNTYNITQEGQLLAGPCPVLNLDASNKLSYPGTGTTWKDLSGNDNNGTLNGGVAYNTGNGGAMGFDGVIGSAQFSPITYKTTQPWSYSISMMIPSGWDNNWRNIINSGNDTDSTWLFHGGSQFIFYQDFYNTTWIWNTGLYIGTQIPNDTFFILTVTCEPVSTYQTNFKVYINGIIKSQTIFTWSNRLAEPRQIFDRVGGSGSRYFLGKTQYVSIYDKALNSSEIQQNFNALRGRYGL